MILLAAVAHATWNLAAKQAGAAGSAFVLLNAATSAVIYLPVAIATFSLQGFSFTIHEIVAVVVSGALHVGYFLLLQRGYRAGDLSLVYPLARGTGPLLSMLGAIVVFGERPSPLALTGALIVIAGVVVLAMTAWSPALPGDSWGKLWHGGLGYGMATGVLIAAYTLWDARAVGVLGMSPIIFEWSANACRVLLLAPVAAVRPAGVWRVWQEQRREVLIVAVLAPLAYVLVLIAFTMAPVSYVAPARELSIVIGVSLGSGLLAEGKGLQRAAAAAGVVVGILMLAAG